MIVSKEAVVSVFRITKSLYDLLIFIGNREERNMTNIIYFLMHKALKSYQTDDEEVMAKIRAYLDDVYKKNTKGKVIAEPQSEIPGEILETTETQEPENQTVDVDSSEKDILLDD